MGRKRAGSVFSCLLVRRAAGPGRRQSSRGIRGQGRPQRPAPAGPRPRGKIKEVWPASCASEGRQGAWAPASKNGRPSWSSGSCFCLLRAPARHQQPTQPRRWRLPSSGLHRQARAGAIRGRSAPRGGAREPRRAESRRAPPRAERTPAPTARPHRGVGGPPAPGSGLQRGHAGRVQTPAAWAAADPRDRPRPVFGFLFPACFGPCAL